MNDRTPRATVTDAEIAAMFARRSRLVDGSDLRRPILAAAASVPQVRPLRHAIGARFSTRTARLLVAAALLLAAAAAAMLASGRFRTDPLPTETSTASWFVRPFEYTIPAGTDVGLAVGGPHRRAIAWVDDANAPLRRTADFLYGEQRPDSGKARGIIVASGEHAWSHAGERYFLRPSPSEFIADLRDRSGVPMGPITDTTLDGRPAFATVLTGATDNDIHVDGPITGLTSGPYVLVGDPARLIVTEIDGETVFVLVWARTSSDLDAWLPVADRLIGSIRFLPPRAQP